MALKIISGVIFRFPRSEYSNSDVPSKVKSDNTYASKKKLKLEIQKIRLSEVLFIFHK